MFKTLTTLIRGAAAKAEEDFADRHALLILDQQIRDAASATDGAKRALSIAIAQDESEGKRLEATLKRIADLEERATAALADGRDDLATEAAEAIALMEAGPRRDQGVAPRVRRRRRAAQDPRSRMPAIAWPSSSAAGASRSRPNRSGASRRAAASTEAPASAALAEAERTLKRLRERQAEEAAAAAAYDTLAPGLNPDATASRLEAAGYGRRTRADRGRRARAAAREDRQAARRRRNRSINHSSVTKE